MSTAPPSVQGSLSQRLRPLAYALAAIVALILGLGWGVLQVQVTLAGFLNGESLWSKAQKQAVIDLDAYAASGNPADLAGFRRNVAVVLADRRARDVINTDHFSHAVARRAFEEGEVIPSAIPGMIFMFDHFSGMPYMREAVRAWRSTDGAVDELGRIAGQLERAYARGRPDDRQVQALRARIRVLNTQIEPQTKVFSRRIAEGATWISHVLFAGVAGAAVLACLLWLSVARRILGGIRNTEERYRLLFDSAADAIVLIDNEDDRILDANRQACDWTGRDAGELVGRPFASVFERESPQGSGMTLGALRTTEGFRPVEMQQSRVTWGERTVRQAIIRDISERISMEQERRIAAEALAGIAEGVIIADADRRVVSVNAAHGVLTGLSLQQVQGRRFDELRRMPDGAPLPDSVWETIASGSNWLGEVQSERSDGSTYPELLSICAIRDPGDAVQHYVAVFTNISSAKANQRRLEHMATRDLLTGLVNRAEFERQCARAIAAAEREHRALAVLFIDLDAFKVVNDSYSHAAGDRLLVRVAECITRHLGEHDVAGRIGGDEFTVLLGRLNSREQASTLAQQLLAALSEPVVVGDYEIALSASIGIAGYPLDGGDPVALIASADAAMYTAKTQERNAFRFYTPMMQADARRRLTLASELRLAMSRGEFRMVYQPSVDMRSGRLVAVEALLRWRHPERGDIAPGEFIPVAEKLGLIRHIDAWVLGTVTRQMRQWDDAGLPPIRVAVNISAHSYGMPAFVEEVKHRLAERHLPAQRLLLEITEGAILQLGDDLERTLHALHALGVGVAIDDFGTGYSSMAYLKLPAVAFLKIDQSFVAGLPGHENDGAIVDAMLAIAKRLGLCTIAEGIETEEQHEYLLRAGCEEGQGYLYARPLEVTQIERMLRSHARPGITRLRVVPPHGG